VQQNLGLLLKEFLKRLSVKKKIKTKSNCLDKSL
jgi:hypothetical protein